MIVYTSDLSIYFLLLKTDKSTRDYLASFLRDHGSVEEVHALASSHDFLVRTTPSTQEAFGKLIDEIVQTYPIITYDVHKVFR